MFVWVLNAPLNTTLAVNRRSVLRVTKTPMRWLLRKKTIAMTISSGGFTKQKHCLQKHLVSSTLFLNSVNNVVKALT